MPNIIGNMETNNENKIKFFAQYWGQEVGQLEWRQGHDTEPIVRIDGSSLNDWEDEISHLLLTPLLDITDEHALELSKVCFPAKKELHTIIFGYRILAGAFGIENFKDGTKIAFKTSSLVSPDYLRSKGYALPWMGISVEKQIEAGWIKLKNDEKKS